MNIVLSTIAVAACLVFAVGVRADATPRFTIFKRTVHHIHPQLFGQFMERPSWGETGPEGALVPGTNALQSPVLKLLKEMQIPILRFPGGTDVDYMDWRDMASNVPERSSERPVSTGHRGHQVTNSFGYDEFLGLAERLGSEKILVVNFRDALSGKLPLNQAARNAAELVAYCNAPVGTVLPEGMPDWPSVRAQNGRETPYGVHYWQIGNETWCFLNDGDMAGLTAEKQARRYADCVAAYVTAMREIDPSIRFIVDGPEVLEPAAALVRDEMGDAVAYFAVHSYTPWGIREVKDQDGDQVPIDDLTAEEIWNAWVATPDIGSSGLADLGLPEVEAARRRNLKLAMTEWNWNGGWAKSEKPVTPALSSSWAKGIGAAGYIHALMRAADVVSIGCQSMLVGHSWGITAIRADVTGKTPAYYMPTGELTAFYSSRHGDRMLEMTSSNVATYKQPYRMSGIRPYEKVAIIDALATGSDDAVFFHAINRSFHEDIDIDVDLSAFAPLPRVVIQDIMEGRLNDHPRDDEPRRIARTTSRRIPIEGTTLRLTLPKRSVSCLKMSLVRGAAEGS